MRYYPKQKFLWLLDIQFNLASLSAACSKQFWQQKITPQGTSRKLMRMIRSTCWHIKYSGILIAEPLHSYENLVLYSHLSWSLLVLQFFGIFRCTKVWIVRKLERASNLFIYTKQEWSGNRPKWIVWIVKGVSGKLAKNRFSWTLKWSYLSHSRTIPSRVPSL